MYVLFKAVRCPVPIRDGKYGLRVANVICEQNSFSNVICEENSCSNVICDQIGEMQQNAVITGNVNKPGFEVCEQNGRGIVLPF